MDKDKVDKDKEKDEVVFQIKRLEGGAWDIQRQVSPELLGILTIEIELIRMFLVSQAIDQGAGRESAPTDPVDEIYIPPPGGNGH